MLTYSLIKNALIEISEVCQALWEENKDLQGRFVNDLTELQHIHSTINQLEIGHKTEILAKARLSISNMQRKASRLYETLVVRRCCLIQKLNDGVHNIALFQNQLITDRLYTWKNRQKLAQVGFPFEEQNQLLDEIQSEFELLAEQIWHLRTIASWLLDLLKRGPQLNDTVQSNIADLNTISDSLTKLLCMLISQSFVVTIQPDSVLKTQHKFLTEVQLLIGDKLGIKQHLVNTNVTIMIITEEDAHMLSTAQTSQKDIKPVGSISNDFEKLTSDENGHMSASFVNSKLIRIAHRKPPSKGNDSKASLAVQTATDQKYALLFRISSFQLGNLGKFELWTLSLPIMVTVHGSQDCDAKGSILWQRAFANVNRTMANTEVTTVCWPQLANLLKHKFLYFTGARRPISDSDLSYMAEKLGISSNDDRRPITFHQFTRQHLKDDVSFSFWEWFFAIMQLIKHKLLKFWDEGWLIGFISKHNAANQMVNANHSTFLLRFSDTQTGAISISFVCEEGNEKIPFHLSPFSIKDLEQFSLAQRIASCPQLKEIKYLYPNIDKDEMLRFFDLEERQRSISPTGYIQSEIVMVAKTESKSSFFSSPNGDICLSLYQSNSDWSPSEANQRIQTTDMNDEFISTFAQDTDNNVETLLGSDFHVHLSKEPLQPVDLSFIDVNFSLANCEMTE